MKKISYKIEFKDKIYRYIFQYIFSIIGILAEEITDDTIPDIFYGNDRGQIPFKIFIKFKADDIIWKDILSDSIKPVSVSDQFPFDIINAVKVLLTDLVNWDLPDIAFDNTDRLKFSESYQFKHKIHEIPLINKYILFFKEVIKLKFEIIEFYPLWKDNKKYAIGLSHDVDFPDKYAPRYSPLIIPGSSVSKHIKMYQKKITSIFRRMLDPFPDNHWLFKQIMDSESKYGFKSTFFFATINKFDPYGSVEDVNYNIRNFRFKNIITEIISSSFEVGLHTSYNAFNSWEQIQNEVKILESISGIKVIGNRHHAWHMGRNAERTIFYHEKAGLLYDSSFAFNDHLGFRRNVAMPFYPWNFNEDRPFKVMQLPMLCMDGNLFYKPVKTSDAIDIIIKYLNIIKENNGLGIIDWHVRTSFPVNNQYTEWGKAYQEVLKYLSNDQDAWVTNLKEIFDWSRHKFSN